jgi:hypothetical protein
VLNSSTNCRDRDISRASYQHMKCRMCFYASNEMLYSAFRVLKLLSSEMILVTSGEITVKCLLEAS